MLLSCYLLSCYHVGMLSYAIIYHVCKQHVVMSSCHVVVWFSVCCCAAGVDAYFAFCSVVLCFRRRCLPCVVLCGVPLRPSMVIVCLVVRCCIAGVDGEGGGFEVQSGGEDRGAPRQRQGIAVRAALCPQLRYRAQRPGQCGRTKVACTAQIR